MYDLERENLMNVNSITRFRTAVRYMKKRETPPRDVFLAITAEPSRYCRVKNGAPMTQVESHLRAWWCLYFSGLKRDVAIRICQSDGAVKKAYNTPSGWLGVESYAHDNSTSFQEYMELGLTRAIDLPQLELRFPKFDIEPTKSDLTVKKCQVCEITKTHNEFYIAHGTTRRPRCKCCEAQEKILCNAMAQ